MNLTPRTCRKSSHSGADSGNCVEVGTAAGTVAVRDSKNQAGPPLAMSATMWQEFTCRVKSGTAHPA
jgi:Domain of unknown function (DUF397)